jgi:hypothetical protein
MSHPITRCYESVRQVSGLEAELNAAGFQTAKVLPNAAIGAGAKLDDLTESIARLGILRAQAVEFAKLIRGGGAVAIVPSHFGTGGKAVEILGKYNPIRETAATPPDKWDAAAPFSSLLRLPVLSRSGAFKGNSGQPLLIEQKGKYESFSGEPLLIAQEQGYRSLSGTPLLLSGVPYKSFSGNPLLLDQPGDYQPFSGTPLLLDSRTLFLTRA